MPLPSSTIGFYDFGNQYRGATTQYQAGVNIAQQMSGLGKRIADSISYQNQQKEARELTPVIGAEYQSGLQKIMAGDVGGGLGQIYSTSAMASQNPLLARMTNDANQAAGYIANNYLKGQLLGQEYGLRENLANTRFQNQMTLQNDAQQARTDLRGSAGVSPQQLQSRYRSYWTNRDKLVEEINAARSEGNETRLTELRDRLIQEDATVLKNGMNMVQDDGTPFLSQEQADAVGKVQQQFSKLKAVGAQGEDAEKVIREYNQFMHQIRDRGQKLVDQRLQSMGAQAPIEGELPDLGAPNEDIAPIVGDEDQVLTPDAVLERVRQGTMTKEEARKIAQQQGWQ